MSTDKRKINISILPEQTENYSQYEESEFNWGRIIPAVVLVLIIVASTLYLLLKNEEAPTNKIDSVDSTEQIPNKPNTETSASSEPEKNQTTLKETVPSVTKLEPITKATEANASKLNKAQPEKKTTKAVDAPLIKKMASNIKVDAKPVTEAHQKKPTTQQKKPDIHLTKAVSPVKILDTHINKAQLSSNLVKGLPVDNLSSQVLMSEEGIIRVHLYTEMENLRGQSLFHHWYLNGEKQARVRVPINHNQQRSSSSKFINRQMLGKWTVQVLDEQGKAYIEVNFEVVSP